MMTGGFVWTHTGATKELEPASRRGRAMATVSGSTRRSSQVWPRRGDTRLTPPGERNV